MPIIHALESDGTATFYFTEGPIESSLPPGFEDFFGEPPHRSFHGPDTFTSFGSMVHNSTPSSLEDAIYHSKHNLGHEAIVEAITTLGHLIETEGPFDGILGFSEGSSIAATFLADHLTKSRAAGKDSMLKLGIFWGGLPPSTADGKRWFLPSTDGQIFDLPTLHIIGSRDPFLATAMLLYNLCEPNSATLFDHGKGHIIVWEPEIVKSLIEVFREQIAAISCR